MELMVYVSRDQCFIHLPLLIVYMPIVLQPMMLNCMHTFCRYCIKEWKKNSHTCPVCRTYILFETHNFLVDNIVNIIVSCQTEEEKSNRVELVDRRRPLASKRFSVSTLSLW